MLKYLLVLSFFISPMTVHALNEGHDFHHSHHSRHSRHHKHSCPALIPIGINNIFAWNGTADQVIAPAPATNSFVTLTTSTSSTGSAITLTPPTTVNFPSTGGTFIVSLNLVGAFTSIGDTLVPPSDIATFRFILNGVPVGLPMPTAGGLPANAPSEFTLSYQTLLVVPAGVEALQVQLESVALGSIVTLEHGVSGITVVQVN